MVALASLQSGARITVSRVFDVSLRILASSTIHTAELLLRRYLAQNAGVHPCHNTHFRTGV